ncbi:hypothetical protein ILUMI_09263 [Ignelater luminosus]|uniref:Sm domain-containing protein n=1 Tax=Ignelater luminosus TaxID=2038154 RepID=A0A8K0GF80_IGNLU|nr:hypothetical protein ILUMI_09263 [Ignelater luminosus]
METMTGPLSSLKKCKDEHIRIKVWTRHSHDVRGYCIAFVTLFDKHWNLVLEDVTEVWTRPKRRKVLPVGLGIQQIAPDRKRLVPPPIEVIKKDKKTETCQRHVDQLLIRGEQISHIVVLIPSD